MLMCALIFWIVILCVDHVMRLTIVAMSSLSRWLCWDDGCRMWLFIRYVMLRMFVKMWISCVWCCVLWIVIRMAFSLALRMFCRPWSLSPILRFLVGEYTHDMAVLPMPCSSGGMNEPSMYMHCWGLNLSVGILYSYIILYYIGKGCVGWLIFGWLYCGAWCPALEYFIFSLWRVVWVGLFLILIL